MKKWLKHIFTITFGLLVYLIIIAINDVYSPNWDRWGRGWVINLSEIGMSIMFSYGCVFIADSWLKWRKNKSISVTPKGIFKELLFVFLSVALFINLVGGPIMEVTDNYDLHDVIVVNVIPGLFTLTYYFILRGNFYLSQYVKNKTLLERVENDKIKEELKYLKNQIHPHFLFNALNTIYFQMDESVSQAKQSIEMFSDLLRYRLYDNQDEKTPIARELDFIEKYIAFEKLRHSDKLKTEVSISHNDPNLEVYPFLINPLIENAFKYVGGKMCMKIDITANLGVLKAVVENSKSTKQIESKKDGGIGLANLRRRLELLYPEKFNLVVQDSGASYKSELTINLNEA